MRRFFARNRVANNRQIGTIRLQLRKLWVDRNTLLSAQTERCIVLDESARAGSNHRNCEWNTRVSELEGKKWKGRLRVPEMTMRVPTPSSLVIFTSPFISSTICFTIDNPSPVPVCTAQFVRLTICICMTECDRREVIQYSNISVMGHWFV